MANTYSQITIHAVFAVKNRDNYIIGDWRDSLHQYISGIITGKGSVTKISALWAFKNYICNSGKYYHAPEF